MRQSNVGKRLLRLWLILCVGVSCGRNVSVPTGPLVRVEGQAVSLRCEVSDYEGPSEQDFDWKAKRGLDSIPLISTLDNEFSDASVNERVLNKEISVHRLGDNAVELRIAEVRLNDSATYICSTLSTDSVISGNYEAEVQLEVVPNTLVVTPDPSAPAVFEGRSISLRCNISHQFIEGIYLSVTWSRKKGQSKEEEKEELLTFGPDADVTFGASLAQRYADGGMRLQLDSGGSFGLVLSGAGPADQGTYVCTSRLWTKEKGSWNRIQEKSAVMGEVAVVPTAKSLAVKVLNSTILTTGDNLNLTCLVLAQDFDVLGLEVTWLLNGTQVLTHLGRDGVVRKSSNALAMTQVGEGSFTLEILRAEMSDMGLYSCRVRAWVQHSLGKWYQAAEKTSTPIQVLVTLKNPRFSVVLESPAVAQYFGDPTELVCRVSNISHGDEKLGVSWFYSVASPAVDRFTPDVIASLNENGVLEPGEKYWGRIEAGLMVITRQAPATFKLRLVQTTNADAGEYACSVSTWSPTRDGVWRKTSEHQSRAMKISLASKRPGVIVVARNVQQAMSIGSPFEMTCQATLKNLREGVALSLLILVQEGVGTPSRKLASLTPDLVLKLEDGKEPSRKDALSLVKTGKNEFRLRIQAVQVTDRGYYSCEVSAFSRLDGNDWVETAKGESNKIHLTFEHIRPTFDLSVSSDRTSIYPWETFKIFCIVSVSGTSPNPDQVAYEIRWYLRHFRGSDSVVLLAGMDRQGVVKKSPRNGSSDCSLERLKSQTFALNIHSTQESDAGEYYCIATPWLRSSTTGLWSKEPDITSKGVLLIVKFALWDSMKLPLLYGTCTSLSVGLISLILGLVCTRCCCRNATHAPRSRIKLMDLDAD